MGSKIPINTNQSPIIVMELIFRLKVRDVMNSKIYSAGKDESLRSLQKLMRKKKITGVPIVDKKSRVIGIISMDDIVNALDKGYINEAAQNYMTRKIKVIEDDMPLSIAIADFKKFKYGRFPVVNKKKELVGIITQGDIISKLLIEINHEISKLETKIPEKKSEKQKKIEKKYKIKHLDFENAGKVSTEIKKMLKNKGLDARTLRRAAIAAFELEINIVIHSRGGTMEVLLDDKKVQLTAEDKGPGIPDVELALTQGFTTANDQIKALGFGAGMGLPNVKRVSDSFKITSSSGKPTIVKSTIKFKN
jgi:CBS domain-containing protein/anti-sigma regulatory factor (Ser/Thr protein kinase)